MSSTVTRASLSPLVPVGMGLAITRPPPPPVVPVGLGSVEWTGWLYGKLASVNLLEEEEDEDEERIDDSVVEYLVSHHV